MFGFKKGMFVLNKENIVTVSHENEKREIVELDKLLAAIAFDESIFEQLNILKRGEQS